MSVTAVPIAPIAKGSMLKLWICLALVAAVAGFAAWAGTSKQVKGCSARNFAQKGASAPVGLPSGLYFQTLTLGQGPKPTEADVVLVNYKGTLVKGTLFDEGQRTPFPVQGMIPGFTEGLKQMQAGGSYQLCIPPELGYGDKSPTPKIPANATLIFNVDLLDFRSMAEIQAAQAQMQGGGAVPPGH
jgi:FKBP-type peptidyl-prolyl cis-trans isomerase FkpA